MSVPLCELIRRVFQKLLDTLFLARGLLVHSACAVSEVSRQARNAGRSIPRRVASGNARLSVMTPPPPYSHALQHSLAGAGNDDKGSGTNGKKRREKKEEEEDEAFSPPSLPTGCVCVSQYNVPSQRPWTG